MDYYPIVFTTIYSKVGNKDTAKDICQEVFMTFFEKFNEIENARSWLLGTLRNKIMKYYRDKKDKNVNIEDVFEDVSLTFVNGFRDTRILIKEAIDNIECSKEERMIIDLIATHNYEYTYTAKLMGLTRRKVEYRYNALVRKIIDYLQKKGINNIEDLL